MCLDKGKGDTFIFNIRYVRVSINKGKLSSEKRLFKIGMLVCAKPKFHFVEKMMQSRYTVSVKRKRLQKEGLI